MSEENNQKNWNYNLEDETPDSLFGGDLDLFTRNEFVKSSVEKTMEIPTGDAPLPTDDECQDITKKDEKKNEYISSVGDSIDKKKQILGNKMNSDKIGYVIIAACALMFLLAGGYILANHFITPKNKDAQVIAAADSQKEAEENTYVYDDDAPQDDNSGHSDYAEKAENTPLNIAPVTSETVNTEPEPVATESEIEPQNSSIVEIDGLGATSYRYPTSKSDYVEYTVPSGNYSFYYPDNFFYEGYYDADKDSVYMKTYDSAVILSIERQPLTVSNDPVASEVKCSNDLAAALVQMPSKEKPYQYCYENISDTGYARSITCGQYENNRNNGAYNCTVCTRSEQYVLNIYHPWQGEDAIGMDYTDGGYVLDCIYRGWSISGTHYQIRTFDEYMRDDLGSKKPEYANEG